MGARKLTLVALAMAALVVLTGCSGVPDRRAATEGVTRSLVDLPMVAEAEGRYTNGIDLGVGYVVRVTVEPDTPPQELAALGDQVDELITQADLAGHDVELVVIRPEAAEPEGRNGRQSPDQVKMTGDGRLEDTGTTLERWGRLSDDLVEEMTWGEFDSSGIDYIVIRSVDVPATVHTLREVAADLESAQWVIFRNQNRIELRGGFPPDDIAEQLEAAALTGNSRFYVYDPAVGIVTTSYGPRMPASSAQTTR